MLHPIERLQQIVEILEVNLGLAEITFNAAKEGLSDIEHELAYYQTAVAVLEDNSKRVILPKKSLFELIDDDVGIERDENGLVVCRDESGKIIKGDS